MGHKTKKFFTIMIVKKLKRYSEVEDTPQKHAGMWNMGKESILEETHGFLITNT